MSAAPNVTSEECGKLVFSLRQMIAVLERARQALATLDADGLLEAAREKEALCDVRWSKPRGNLMM